MKTQLGQFNVIICSTLLVLTSCKKSSEIIQSAVDSQQLTAQKTSYKQPTLNKALSSPRSFIAIGKGEQTATDVFHIIGNFPTNTIYFVEGFTYSPADCASFSVNGNFGGLYYGTFGVNLFPEIPLTKSGADIFVDSHYNGLESGTKSGDTVTTWLSFIETDSNNYDIMKPVAGVTRMLVGGSPYYHITSSKDSGHIRNGWNEVADLLLGADADGGRVNFKSIPLLITGLNTQLLDTPRLVSPQGDTIPETINMSIDSSAGQWSAAITLNPNIAIAPSYVKKFRLFLHLKVKGMAQVVTSANEDKKKFIWKDVLGNKVFSIENTKFYVDYPLHETATVQNFPF